MAVLQGFCWEMAGQYAGSVRASDPVAPIAESTSAQPFAASTTALTDCGLGSNVERPLSQNWAVRIGSAALSDKGLLPGSETPTAALRR